MQSKSIPALLTCGWIVLCVAPVQAQQRLSSSYEQQMEQCVRSSGAPMEVVGNNLVPKNFEEIKAECRVRLGTAIPLEQLTFDQRVDRCVAEDRVRERWGYAHGFRMPSKDEAVRLSQCRVVAGPPGFIEPSGQRLPYQQRMANCMSPDNVQGIDKVRRGQEHHGVYDPYQNLLAWCRDNLVPDR